MRVLSRRSFLTAAASSLTIASPFIAKSEAVEKTTEFDPYRMAWEADSDIFTRNVSYVGVKLQCLLDISGSINTREYGIQRDGTAAAFESKAVISAIIAQGGIACSIIQFGKNPETKIPWAILQNDKDVEVMANIMRKMNRPANNPTGLIKAIKHAQQQSKDCPTRSERSIIDISGDGNDYSSSDDAQIAANAVLSAINDCTLDAIRCNAISLPNDNLSNLPQDCETVVEFFEKYAITPDGAVYYDEYGYENKLQKGFVVNATSWGAFKDAIELKLRTEIMGQIPPAFKRSFG